VLGDTTTVHIRKAVTPANTKPATTAGFVRLF